MNLLKQLSLQVRFFIGSLLYVSYTPQAYQYSRWRDYLERKYLTPSTTDTYQTPGKLLNAETTAKGGNFYFEQAELEISFLTSDFVRVDWKPGIPPIPYAQARQEWTELETKLEATGDGWTLASKDLKVYVGVDGSLKWLNLMGQTLREELPPQRQDESWQHQAKLKAAESIYGLGEKAAHLNLRKRRDETQVPRYRMWNYDAAGMYGPGSDPMYICIPVYMGLNTAGSYLVFYENSYESYFTFDDLATAEFTGGALRYYITIGTPPQLLERYTELTGRSPLPARWALGYHQSRWGYKNEAAIRQTVKDSKKYNLPLSAIHLDIDCQVGYRAFTIDPDRFPNLPAFTKELLEDGVRFITILNPGIKYSRHSNLFLEGQLLDAFCRLPSGRVVIGPVWPGWCVFPDYTNPTVRKWWSRQYQYMLDVGVAGFWHDMNEPAAFILWGDRSLPKPTQHYMEGRGGDHREAHNIYGMLQAQASFESLCEYKPEHRPFIVSRAGWAGLQRYAWTWTGDVECTWESLGQTISIIIGLGLSGIPYTGSDIAGFQGNPPAELYLRWFQMATFHPFYRSHCANNVEYRAPWTYGEPYLSIIREYLNLRYRLMPYFYTLAWEASQKGYPLVRPVFWNNSEDAALWDVEDAFLLGDGLMVCPITEPEGRMRQVVLPKGRWYNFWDDTILEGPGLVNLEAPLERIPLLVKAGTILPMESGKQLILHLYPPEQEISESVIYNDAGDGYAEWRLDQFRIVKYEHGSDLFWEKLGTYPFQYTDVQIHLHGMNLQQAWIDGNEVSCEDNCVKSNVFHKIYLKTVPD